MIHSINPATGETLQTFEAHTPAQVEAALSLAAQAQKQWARLPLSERTSLLRRVAALLRERKAEYGALITLEMGKPVLEAEAEIEKCAWNCEFYADKATEYLGDEVVDCSATSAKVVYDPLGIVLAVMPWNYPFWQVMRFAAPALAAGNGAVLKHANNVPQCALALEQVFRDAGAPAGLFTTLLVEASAVKGLIEDPRIAAVTLTGSTPVGKLVASQAGAVLKKQVLELGGSDAFIVLADADIELAAKTAVKARFSNVGQSCISAKRFIVVESVADQFTARFCHYAAQLKMGDPMQRDVTIGPLARANLRDELHAQVEKSVAQGAKLLLGGKFVEGPGFFYEPTVLDQVSSSMAAGCEETFGPAAAIMRVKDTEAAIALANSLDYGLGAGLWTQDVQTGEQLARRIEAGAVFINGIVASDPRYPFGGIKQSGYGRELGVHGAREFTNIKTVWIGPAR
jgi:succinate-semialdehyde dehydrogenase / glutarate-semialdehyde dehydrogenase